jgi:hypothetical protein
MLIPPPTLPPLKLFNPLGGLLCGVTFLTARSLANIILRGQTQIQFSKHTMCFLFTDPDLM